MEWTISLLKGKYKTQGRTRLVNDLLMLDYSATGFEFDFNGSGDVAVTFWADNVALGELGGCYFTAIVDGDKMPRDFIRVSQTGESTFVIAKDLPQGEHKIRIYRQTEVEWATIGILSVLCDGEPYAPPKKDLYIEFIGDSITTAFGNLTDNKDESFRNPIHQDASVGYAYLTAKALDADFSMVARQGIGASVGYQPIPMQVIYPYHCQVKDSATLYKFDRQPDINIIALGTNDINAYNNKELGNNKTLEEVKSGFAEFLKLVRKHNPSSKIVWIYGMMTNNANSLITEVISEAGGEENGYYSLRVPQNNMGGQGHPHYTGHEQIAKTVAEFLKTLV